MKHERHEEHEKQRRGRNGHCFFLSFVYFVPFVVPFLPFLALAQDDLSVLEEQAMRAAVERVAPSVVRIETVGGLERVGGVLFGAGPTTGVIVSSDGYIISSAFNFAQRPSSILVGLPDGTRIPAELVATDHNRMLTLLKISVDEALIVPEAVPESEMQVGQWAIAVGRTFEGGEPNISVGIVSALSRIFGKALQTDAKISPANYGGPLIDIHGRVLGILVPLSPQGTDEVAGVEWYDSGIGFAVPLAHVQKIQPQLAAGNDLRPGIMGVNIKRGGLADPAELAAVRPNSPAYDAGFKAGDRIVEIDGKTIERNGQVREQTARRYAGETIKVVAIRGEQRIERELELVDKLDPYQHAFLGILPLRAGKDDAGVVKVRYVYPQSPAANAGLAAGDVITGFQGEMVAGANDLVERINALKPGDEVQLQYQHAAAAKSTSLKLGTLPEDIPAELPPAHEDRTPAGSERPAVGKLVLKVAEFENECLAYVPETYDPQVGYGLLIWLHASGGDKEEELLSRWKAACEANSLILVAPRSQNPNQWGPRDRDFIGKVLEDVRATYNIDRHRVVAHGYQSGGAMAYIVAFANRDLVRAVAAVDGTLVVPPPENEPINRLAFFTTKSGKGRTPARQVDAIVSRLREMKYPVTVRDLGEEGRYLSDDELAELVRWMDTLDRM
jgi:serine protease Do